MSTEQRENLEAILRQSAFPADIDIGEQRRQLRELTSAQPLPAGVTVTATALGRIPIAEITIDGIGAVATSLRSQTAAAAAKAAGHPLAAIRVTREDLSGVDPLAAPAD